MPNGELFIRSGVPQRDIKGRFNKGCVSPTKGMKWEDMYSPEDLEKRKEGMRKHLKECQGLGARAGRKVVCVNKAGKFIVFNKIVDACAWSGKQPKTLQRYLQKKRIPRGNVRWFYEDDNEWTDYVTERENQRHNPMG